MAICAGLWPAPPDEDRRGVRTGRSAGNGGRGARAHPKIALEEHFSLPEFEQRGLVARPARLNPMWADIGRRLVDLGDLRLEAMDAAGIDLSVLSLTLPGIQGEKEPATAVRLARQA